MEIHHDWGVPKSITVCMGFPPFNSAAVRPHTYVGRAARLRLIMLCDRTYGALMAGLHFQLTERG